VTLDPKKVGKKKGKAKTSFLDSPYAPWVVLASVTAVVGGTLLLLPGPGKKK
jgi:hypothetical protein